MRVTDKIVGFAMIQLILCLTGCARFEIAKQKLTTKFTKSKASTESNKAEPNNSAVKLEWFPVRSGDIDSVRETPGQLSYSEKIEIRADKRTRIGPAKIELNAKIKRGALIFEADKKDAMQKRTELSERLRQVIVDRKAAVAQMEFAQKQFDRKKSLESRGIAAKKDIEETEKQLRIAETTIQARDLDLNKTERELAEANETVKASDFFAPVDGIISQLVNGDEDVVQGQVVATVSSPGRLSVFIDVDENLISSIRPTDPVDVKIPSAQGATIKGLVKNVATTPTERFGKSTYEVRVDLGEKDINKLNLREGYEASVIVRLGKSTGTLIAPLAALQSNGGAPYLLVAGKSGGTPVARAIKTGIRTDLEVEILSGVKAGEFAVVPTGGIR